MIFFFFNDTATTEIYTLSLHDALPICPVGLEHGEQHVLHVRHAVLAQRLHHLVAGDPGATQVRLERSEEHTSELQSRPHLVCRLLLEKKKILLCTTDHQTLVNFPTFRI